MGQQHTETLNAILREYGTRSDMRVWPSGVGAARYGDKVVRFGVPGQADLTGIVPVGVTCRCPRCATTFHGRPQGVRLEVEVKAGRDVQREKQQAYQAMVERFGGVYVLAYGPADVAAALARLRGDQI